MRKRVHEGSGFRASGGQGFLVVWAFGIEGLMVCRGIWGLGFESFCCLSFETKPYRHGWNRHWGCNLAGATVEKMQQSSILVGHLC